MRTKNPKWRAYLGQKGHAKYRGIPFWLTFETWVAWWEEQLGPDFMNKRGKQRDQYVMARLNDRGAYCLGNIKCVTVKDNCAERALNGTSCIGERNGRAKLTKEDVIAIFQSAESNATLGRRYGLDRTSVFSIKSGKNWPSITSNLNKSTLRA